MQPNETILPVGIHIIGGDSAGGIFARTFRARDRLVIHNYVLSCGPTPSCDDLESWDAMRFGYWNDLAPGDIGNIGRTPFDLDWAGGVRLQSSEGRLWFSDGDTLRQLSA